MAKSAPGGGNNFNLEKNREEIQLEKNIDKLSTFLRFVDIFPVFKECLPYFPFLLSILTFFYTISCKTVKNFRRFAPFATFFAKFCVRNGKIFGASRHLKDAMKICTGVG